jgi:hypothetical protein
MTRIIIDKVDPEGIGDDLKGCYYEPGRDGAFDFFDKDGTIKARDVKPGSEFSFKLDGLPDIEWTLSLNPVTEREVCGNWIERSEKRPENSGVGEPEGTYQGQAGGGLDVESASSAGGY